MTATILDGKAQALALNLALKAKIQTLPTAPELAVILVGGDPASQVYVNAKKKACLEVGIKSETYHLSEDISEAELIDFIEDLNNSPEVNGILVQLPLPKHLNEAEILNHISPLKDVDGFTALNTGRLLQKSPEAVIPCTPKGVLKLIKSTQTDLSGLHAVIVGRSQIVGLPIAHLLLAENCTVTVAHSKTKDLPDLCQTADILVVAIGKPEFITKAYLKKGAIVIDVGINRTPQGLKGDVLFTDACEVASYVTPVPKGVGPMTIAMLLENTVEAYLKQQHS
jgi:methylenetetrahydrofolate dehydrogenase (NADP+)/methenyltetrahydrofolate cyclohydrolase